MTYILFTKLDKIPERYGTNYPEKRQNLIINYLLENQNNNIDIIELKSNEDDIKFDTDIFLQKITSLPFLEFLQKSYKSFMMNYDSDLVSTDGKGLIPINFCRYKPKYLNNISIHRRSSYYCKDSMTPIYDITYQSVIDSIHMIRLAITKLLYDETNIIYTIPMAPGHHASMEQYGGYCFINNAVYGALLMQQQCKNIVILDLDYHHGDGSQELTKDMKNITTISLHMNPMYDYPSYTGFKEENTNTNYNFPLEPAKNISGKYIDYYLSILELSFQIVEKIKPSGMIIPLGIDTLFDDPDVSEIGGMGLETDDYNIIGTYIARKIKDINPKIKLLITQEGGYNLEKVPIAVYNFISSLSN